MGSETTRRGDKGRRGDRVRDWGDCGGGRRLDDGAARARAKTKAKGKNNSSNEMRWPRGSSIERPGASQIRMAG